MAPTPRVSVGLAVYNGEEYLAQAIESILAQTFTDFELIISDNASTDRTEEICRQYAAADARIQYSRNPTNIGGANNENRTFHLARGEYFRWAAHDDICAPELIEECVRGLDANPAVVLCYSSVSNIDASGNVLQTISIGKGLAAAPHIRFWELAQRDHNCEITYGLIRAHVLRQTRLQQNYVDSDRTLLCELSLHGPFSEIQRPLFFKRYHPKNMYVDWRARMAWYRPELKGKITFPHWMQFGDYVVIVWRVPLSLRERILCYGNVLRWLVHNGRKLVKDLLVAAYAILVPSARTRQKQNVYNWE